MDRFIRKVARKIIGIILNNPFTNWLLVLLSIDYLPKKVANENNWTKHSYKEEKTLGENVGYSEIPEIQKLVDKAKLKLLEFSKANLKPGDSILDIGCGTGIFLKGLENNGFDLNGIDMNRQFLAKAEENLPNGHFYLGNYIESFRAVKKFKLICNFSVLMYIEPSNIKRFFDKLYEDLEVSGYAFIQYPHAMKFSDLFYPNITYVKYSPHKIEKLVHEKFNIIRHEHFYDGRKIDWYDNKHYYFPDGTNKRLDTIENTYLLIIQKPAT